MINNQNGFQFNSKLKFGKTGKKKKKIWTDIHSMSQIPNIDHKLINALRIVYNNIKEIQILKFKYTAIQVAHILSLTIMFNPRSRRPYKLKIKHLFFIIQLIITLNISFFFKCNLSLFFPLIFSSPRYEVTFPICFLSQPIMLKKIKYDFLCFEIML